jgi:hypothetical protein
MRLNHAPAVLAMLLTAAQRPHPAFEYGSMLGVAVEKPDGTCLDIRNASLSAGERIHLITTSVPPTIAETEITRKASKACTVADQNAPGLYHYEFKVVHGPLEKGVLTFALVSYKGPLSVTRTGVTGDLDGDGRPVSFRFCASSEGIHLTAWKGEALKGTRKWHYYYYLGYDVDPDCTEADTKP